MDQCTITIDDLNAAALPPQPPSPPFPAPPAPPAPPPPPPVAVPATTCGADTTVQAVDALSQAVHTAPGTALQVKLCDPVASLKLEFSETLLFSAATEQKIYRIREYNEDTGAWTVRYEDESGAAVPVGSLPPDLTAVSAQTNVTRTAVIGCANGVPWIRRETARFDAETGALDSEIVDFVDISGAVSATAPAGFTLGACPQVCEVVAPVGVVGNWG